MIKLWNFRRAPNIIIHIHKNHVNSYDSNGVIAVPISTLGDKKRNLPFFCLPILPQNPLNVLGHIIRRWNREKRFRIDREILEISFTNLNLRGGMKSEPLTKHCRSFCDDKQLFWISLKILEQGERRFLLESNTGIQKKPGHHKAGSCFPHISSSVL